ncbi:hypothetical protein FOZ63_021821 [Perkinsus olseni]|uniref:Uncharacterized protein n=1 Tax=Perkinsus olseni TaxID=32597 RepID=A0A7J6SNK7_PEROL|nr:hypothetical protein FOZ63_021821 [Perkinsus olseni]
MAPGKHSLQEDGRRSCRVYSLPLDLSTAESAQLTSGSQSDIPAEGYRFDAPLAGDYRFDKLEPVALSDLIQRGPPGGGVVATFESNEPLSVAASAINPFQYPVGDPPPYDQLEHPMANVRRAYGPDGAPPTYEEALRPMKQSRGLKRPAAQELTDVTKKRRI